MSPAKKGYTTRKVFGGLADLRVGTWSKSITPLQYARGVTACLRNARDLLDEAAVLHGAGKRGRAVALALLAVEQGDAPRLLLRLCMVEDADAAGIWKTFRSHKAKLGSMLSVFTHGQFSFVGKAWERESSKAGIGSTIKDLPSQLKVLKERCMHCDLLADGSWSSPAAVVPEYMCEFIVNTAPYVVMMMTTMVLSVEMAMHGYMELPPGMKPLDPDEASVKGRAFLRWRRSKKGRAWGEREWAQHMKWIKAAAPKVYQALYPQGER